MKTKCFRPIGWSGNLFCVIVASILLLSSLPGCSFGYTPTRGEGTADDEDRELEVFEDVYPGSDPSAELMQRHSKRISGKGKHEFFCMNNSRMSFIPFLKSS